ncbi:PEP-CTERM sorting domain-containing protein [Verrucomicrobiota bacterium]
MRKMVLVLTALVGLGVVAQAAIVDQWDMNNNDQWQRSNNGLNIGGHYNSDKHALAQTDNDGTFLYSPTTTPQGFGPKSALSSSSDLAAGVVRLSMSYSALHFSSNPSANTKIGFRLWNDAGNKFFGIDIADGGDSNKVFAQLVSSRADLNATNAGRLVNGLGPDGVGRTIILELDYANSEVRMSGDWDWAPDGTDQVFTHAYDFAGNGFTDISKFQTTYANWSDGDQITMDDITVEAIPEPATIGLLGAGVMGLLAARSKIREESCESDDQ